MIEISLNGEPTKVAANTNLAQLVAQFSNAEKPVAAAIDGDFVPRSEHRETQLKNGDKIDLVSPVGGG